MSADLTRLPAHELADLLASGEVSSVDATRAHLDRNKRISLECDAIAAHARGDHATERAILDQIHALDTRTTSRVPRR